MHYILLAEKTYHIDMAFKKEKNIDMTLKPKQNSLEKMLILFMGMHHLFCTNKNILFI